MASREELLQSIGPDMRLDKWFFLRIYGYELTWPGFAEVVYTNQKGNHAMNERKERGMGFDLSGCLFDGQPHH